MENVTTIIKDKYKNYQSKLENDFNKTYEENPLFRKVVSKLNHPKKELMKHTTKLEDCAKELSNCQKCKNILECKNSVTGYVYYPELVDNNLVFSYIPCKYQKNLQEQTKWYENVYTFEIPREIKEASMKNIHTDDAERFQVIKWITDFLEKFKQGLPTKGLYLTGNFGCGKTYLISAMLNELAKNNHQVAMIYYPELLRSLKESFKDYDEYNEKFNKIKRTELLLIDDIGAETTTSWGRDEVLGTILQYRMEQGLPTFFTSNLSLKELEEHLSTSRSGVDKVKARRIIERIKQLTEVIELISANKRK